MKTAPHDTRSNHPIPSFFGHVFYWIWEFTPKKGLPDRSWLVVTLVQYAVFLFPITLCIPFFSDDTVRVLYEADDNLKYLPIAVVFLIMLWRNSCIYNERKYQEIKEYYLLVSAAERISRKRRCLLFLVMAVVMIAIEMWLFNLYYERCLLFR